MYISNSIFQKVFRRLFPFSRPRMLNNIKDNKKNTIPKTNIYQKPAAKQKTPIYHFAKWAIDALCRGQSTSHDIGYDLCDGLV